MVISKGGLKMSVSDSQRKATNKYLEKFEDIKLRVPKGKRDEYKSYAASKGLSLNNLVIKLIEDDMKNNLSSTNEKLPE